MKRILCMICLVTSASAVRAQLTTGPSGLTLKAGTTFSSQGLVLIPAADLLLQNDTITLSSTPITVTSGASINRVYTVSSILNFSGTLGIQYAAADLNGNQESTLAIAYASSGNNFTTLTSATGAAGSYYVSSTGLNNAQLKRITAANTGVVLPIVYHDFKAAAGNACTINLGWYADDALAANFSVERSADGKVFRALPQPVVQAGSRFTYTDDAPLAGTNIYRLAISEAGKPLLYSTAAVVSNPCVATAGVKLYPNPAKATLTLAFGTQPQTAVTAVLFDITGKQVKTFRITEQVSVLDIKDLVPGSYFLKVNNGAVTESIKVVKQ